MPGPPLTPPHSAGTPPAARAPRTAAVAERTSGQGRGQIQCVLHLPLRLRQSKLRSCHWKAWLSERTQCCSCALVALRLPPAHKYHRSAPACQMCIGAVAACPHMPDVTACVPAVQSGAVAPSDRVNIGTAAEHGMAAERGVAAEHGVAADNCRAAAGCRQPECAAASATGASTVTRGAGAHCGVLVRAPRRCGCCCCGCTAAAAGGGATAQPPP